MISPNCEAITFLLYDHVPPPVQKFYFSTHSELPCHPDTTRRHPTQGRKRTSSPPSPPPALQPPSSLSPPLLWACDPFPSLTGITSPPSNPPLTPPPDRPGFVPHPAIILDLRGNRTTKFPYHRHRRKRWKMLWLIRLSGFFSAFLLTLLLSPSFHSFPPAEAIRSSHHHLLFHPTTTRSAISSDRTSHPLLSFRTAPSFPISPQCPQPKVANDVCDPSLIHIAITLDFHYLRGSIAAVHSILHHTHCPTTVFFHFIVSDPSSILPSLLRSAFPTLRFQFHHFNPEKVQNLISSSVREALEQPLNYARNYLSEMLKPCIRRIIYLDSDLVVVDDIAKLWKKSLGSSVVGAPEYCHANFSKYYTERFWSDPKFNKTFSGRKPCYFNTGVMVIDLWKWRRGGYTGRIEKWMEVQKQDRIYELGSLPPLMLVFAGRVVAIDHRWNQHGLGGDNVKGSCRSLHSGPVSLLHWSGSGKPWVRIDSRRPCPLDALWAPYDLYQPSI